MPDGEFAMTFEEIGQCLRISRESARLAFESGIAKLQAGFGAAKHETFRERQERQAAEKQLRAVREWHTRNRKKFIAYKRRWRRAKKAERTGHGA